MPSAILAEHGCIKQAGAWIMRLAKMVRELLREFADHPRRADDEGFKTSAPGSSTTRYLGPAFARLDGCGADPELSALAKRCLAAEKADRPADAREVAQAVADHLGGVRERLRQAQLERAQAEVRARLQEAISRWQAAGADTSALTAVNVQI